MKNNYIFFFVFIFFFNPLFAKNLFIQSKNISLDKDKQKSLNEEDFNKGFEKYLDNDEVKNRKNDKNIEQGILNSLYA